MTIKCTNNKTFELTDSSDKLGELTYESLFSYKAHVVVGDDFFTITPKGFFCTHITVTKDDLEVASMQMNWKGNIIINYQDGQSFLFRATGTFNNKYLLEDKDQNKLILLDPNFNWRNFNYNYAVAYETKPKDILLILLTAYAANYYMAATSGSM